MLLASGTRGLLPPYFFLWLQTLLGQWLRLCCSEVASQHTSTSVRGHTAQEKAQLFLTGVFVRIEPKVEAKVSFVLSDQT